MSLTHWLNTSLTYYRAYDAAQNERRRRLAEDQAATALQRIELGQVSGQLRQDRLGDVWDAYDAGLLNPGALFLGMIEGRLLFYNDAKPLLTYGATGTGKFRDVIGANLVHAVGHSVVMTDPKGEGAYCTGQHREAMQGGRVGYANPWRLRGLPNHRINPLQHLIDKAAAGQRINDDALEIVDMLFAGMPNDEGANAWIRVAAEELFHFTLIYLAEVTPEKCTLGTLWDIANCPPVELVDKWLSPMWKSAAGSGFVSVKAKKYLCTYFPEGNEKPREQISWVLDKADKAVMLYGPGSELREAVATTDFDPTRLKREPSTLYLMIDGGKLKSHAQWLSLLVNSIIEGVARTDGDVRTTFILDEFGNLPAMPAALKALRLYRSKGVQLWPFVQGRQSLEGDKFSPRYGVSGRKEFEDQAGIHQMWGVNDSDLAKWLQERAGYRSVVVPNFSYSTSMQAPGSGHSASEQLTPVLPVSEITKIGEGRQILAMQGGWLWVAERHPWWRFEGWADMIRPLPEHAR